VKKNCLVNCQQTGTLPLKKRQKSTKQFTGNLKTKPPLVKEKAQ